MQRFPAATLQVHYSQNGLRQVRESMMDTDYSTRTFLMDRSSSFADTSDMMSPMDRDVREHKRNCHGLN